jgi:hypothetical protein
VYKRYLNTLKIRKSNIKRKHFRRRMKILWSCMNLIVMMNNKIHSPIGLSTLRVAGRRKKIIDNA